MKKVCACLVVIFVVMVVAFAVIHALTNGNRIDNITGQMFVSVNEIQNGDETAYERFDELKEQLKKEARGHNSFAPAIWLALGTCAAFSLYLYFAVLRPFHKLERFSQNIASGEYNAPLEMPRHNVFGAFSWAFDAMREGLRTAQEAEQEAKNANKILIAALSHDIKTPISSIRACAEALSSGQGSNEERRRRYLDTILHKSDQVAQLTNDLFLHALSDMDKLVIEPGTLPLRSFMTELAVSTGVSIVADIPDVSVIADKKRLEEVFGNIINNAGKYAPGAPLEVSFSWREAQEDDLIYCVFSDKGTSLSDEDVPFIFYRFYRGKNAVNTDGSGLGLYIVRYIVEKQGGKVYAHRSEDGFEIVVGLKIAQE